MVNNQDWGEIPTELAAKILEHIELYDDYESLSKVCSTWRLEIKQQDYHNSKYSNKNKTQLPWLMLADLDNDAPCRRFYSLTKRKFLKIDLPPGTHDDDEDDDRIRRYFSSRGWLISVSQKNRRITLFNPFTGDVMDPPPPPVPLDLFSSCYGNWEDWYLVELFGKFVLSTEPNNNKDGYTIAMTYEGSNEIAFWRPGQDRWVEARFPPGY